MKPATSLCKFHFNNFWLVWLLFKTNLYESKTSIFRHHGETYLLAKNFKTGIKYCVEIGSFSDMDELVQQILALTDNNLELICLLPYKNDPVVYQKLMETIRPGGHWTVERKEVGATDIQKLGQRECMIETVIIFIEIKIL